MTSETRDPKMAEVRKARSRHFRVERNAHERMQLPMVDADLNPQVVAQVRDATDLVEVASDHVKLKKRGRKYEGLCPFHEEKTPSFSIDPEKGLFYCFGCHAGGDAIKFVMELERLSFPEAVERLARQFGVHLPAASPDARRRRQTSDRLRTVLEEAQHWFTEQLDSPAGAGARSELERRGYARPTWRDFGFGFAPDDWRQLLEHLERRHPQGVIIEAGLAVQPDSGKNPYDRFRGRLTFPVRDSEGRLIAFGGRILGDGEPKYLNSPESALFHKRSTLFCLDRARRAIADEATAVVVEGYFDCFSLHLVGITNVVATLGTALTSDHARLLRRRLGADGRVVLCYDADSAGRRAAATGAGVLLEAGVTVAVVGLPPGTDPDDVVRVQGGEAMREMLANPSSLVEFLVQDLPDERTARQRGAAELAALVGAARDPHIRDELFMELTQRMGFSEEVLRDLARQMEVSRRWPRRPEPPHPAGAQLRQPIVVGALRGAAGHIHPLAGVGAAIGGQPGQRLAGQCDRGAVAEVVSLGQGQRVKITRAASKTPQAASTAAVSASCDSGSTGGSPTRRRSPSSPADASERRK